jgi:hypothetical protein
MQACPVDIAAQLWSVCPASPPLLLPEEVLPLLEPLELPEVLPLEPLLVVPPSPKWVVVLLEHPLA